MPDKNSKENWERKNHNGQVLPAEKNSCPCHCHQTSHNHHLHFGCLCLSPALQLNHSYHFVDIDENHFKDRHLEKCGQGSPQVRAGHLPNVDWHSGGKPRRGEASEEAADVEQRKARYCQASPACQHGQAGKEERASTAYTVKKERSKRSSQESSQGQEASQPPLLTCSELHLRQEL